MSAKLQSESLKSAKPPISPELVVGLRALAFAIVAAVTLPLLGPSAKADEVPKAGAERGEVRLTWLKVVRYQNFDPADARESQILLSRIEDEAHKLCDGDMVRADRRACEKTLIAAALAGAAEPARLALAQAQADRNEVAQAMR